GGLAARGVALRAVDGVPAGAQAALADVARDPLPGAVADDGPGEARLVGLPQERRDAGARPEPAQALLLAPRDARIEAGAVERAAGQLLQQGPQVEADRAEDAVPGLPAQFPAVFAEFLGIGPEYVRFRV